MSVKMRQIVEKGIATAVIAAAIKAGYSISVNDGEKTTLENSSSKNDVFKAMFTTDEDRLYMHQPNQAWPEYHGWVFFVYGNDGWDVISDYTTNLEHIMPEVNKVIAKYED